MSSFAWKKSSRESQCLRESIRLLDLHSNRGCIWISLCFGRWCYNCSQVPASLLIRTQNALLFWIKSWSMRLEFIWSTCFLGKARYLLRLAFTAGFFWTLFRHPGILKVPTFQVFTLSFEFFPWVLRFFLEFCFHTKHQKVVKKCRLLGL